MKNKEKKKQRSRQNNVVCFKCGKARHCQTECKEKTEIGKEQT